MAVRVDRGGEGSAVPREAARLRVEARRYRSELSLQDLLPPGVAQVALRLVAEASLLARRRVARVKREMSGASDAWPDVQLPRAELELPRPVALPPALMRDEAERRGSDRLRARLPGVRLELLPLGRLALRRPAWPARCRELRARLVLAELRLQEREPPRASARSSLWPRQSSPLPPLLPPPRCPENACGLLPRARYR
jgi:hypothetical protein